MSAARLERRSPAVTCVLIFLDGGRFIDEAIRSVVAQGDAVDWELVLVDDGSTDDSTAIARRWATTDPRIRYLDHDGHRNLGRSASRNAGVAAAHGERIGFLDCDDVWLPGALAHGLRDFALHPDADVVIAGTWRWHGWTGEPADLARDHLMSIPAGEPHTVIEPPALFVGMYADPGQWRIPGICSLLITRSALQRIGGFDDAFLGIYEDQVLYAKIGLHLRAVIDPRPMALYRQHDASACHVAIATGEWQRVGPSEPERRFLEWMRTYVTDHVSGDPVAMGVVVRNLDHAAHGHHVLPAEASPSLRDRVPEPVRQVVRTLRRRWRPPAPLPTVAGRWSEQFLAPVAGAIDGSTLVVEADERGEVWVAAPPADTFGDRVTRWSWRETTSATTRFDRVVVPLGVGAAVDTTPLLADVGQRMAPGAAAYVVVPGPASDASRPDPDALVGMVSGLLPDHRIDVASFGSPPTVDSLDADVLALGPAVDRHDPPLPVVLGITITPARSPR